MKIGVALPAQVAGVARAHVLGFAERAERHGLDSLWVLDRLVYPSLAPLPLLAAAAAVTRRVRLGTSVLLATLWNPVILAKELATIQRLSEGRLVVGLAIGAREPDFQAAQVPMKARGRRLEETVALLRQAIPGQALQHAGEVFSIQGGPVGLPGTPPAPVWLGGFADPALRRAVRLGDGFLVGGRGPDYAREVVPVVRKLAGEAGRDTRKFPIGAVLYACFDTDRDRAARTVGAYIEGYYGRAILEPRKGAICGTSAEAVERMKEYAALDVDTLIVVPVTTDPEQVDRLAEAAAAFGRASH